MLESKRNRNHPSLASIDGCAMLVLAHREQKLGDPVEGDMSRRTRRANVAKQTLEIGPETLSLGFVSMSKAVNTGQPWYKEKWLYAKNQMNHLHKNNIYQRVDLESKWRSARIKHKHKCLCTGSLEHCVDVPASTRIRPWEVKPSPRES